MKVTKGIEKILNNPFSVLGLPCNAEKIDIIKAQEKLNKLSKIGAEKSYKTEFFNASLPEINRSAGIIQASMVKIDELSNKLFWFVDPLYIKQFNSVEVKNEFVNAANFEDVKYDCFLANYLYLLFEDSEFTKIDYWKKILSYIEFLFSCDLSIRKKLLKSRFQASFDDKIWNSILSSIKKHILSPLEDLVDNTDPKRIISLLNILSDYDSTEFDTLRNNLLEQLILEIEKDCSFVYDFVDSIEDIKCASKSQVLEAAKLANKLSVIGKSIIEPLLKSHVNNSVAIDRIKDIFYNEMMKLAYILAFGKSFKNAYACATQANIYAPSHKKSEIKDTLTTFKELKDYAEVIDQAGGIESLSYKDKNLIENDDISISLLAYRAIAGDSEAQLVLGRLYITPIYERKATIDIPYDSTEGLKWIKKAADNGHSKAQLELGACYFTGQGVTQNIITADYWIRKAANQGDSDAKKTLSMLENDYRYRASISQNKTSIPAASTGCLIPTLLSLLSVVIFLVLIL